LEFSECRRDVNNLRTQLDRPRVDKAIGGILRAKMVADAKFNADCRPIILSRDVNYPGLPPDGSGNPVRMINLYLSSTDNPSDDRYVPERHTGFGAEAQNGACFGCRTSVIETGCSGPPTPSVTE
jgi:hypothetical protein